MAEDEPDVRDCVACALWSIGCDVVAAESGAQLLDALGDAVLGGACPDVILTDLRLPGPSGLEILAGLRRAGWMILMTAFADWQTRVVASHFGVDAIFVKPFEVDELATAVKAMARRRPPSPRGASGHHAS